MKEHIAPPMPLPGYDVPKAFSAIELGCMDLIRLFAYLDASARASVYYFHYFILVLDFGLSIYH